MYLRVLEHDIADQIMIGPLFSTSDVAKTAEVVFNMEDTKLDWCGGAKLVAGRYYRKIALVDAVTLKEVAILFDGREWAQSLTQ